MKRNIQLTEEMVLVKEANTQAISCTLTSIKVLVLILGKTREVFRPSDVDARVTQAETLLQLHTLRPV